MVLIRFGRVDVGWVGNESKNVVRHFFCWGVSGKGSNGQGRHETPRSNRIWLEKHLLQVVYFWVFCVGASGEKGGPFAEIQEDLGLEGTGSQKNLKKEFPLHLRRLGLRIFVPRMQKICPGNNGSRSL